MLGKVGPHHHGGGIPLFNLEVDVGNSTVKSAGIGVLDITFHPGCVTCEPEHIHSLPLVVLGGFLETGSVLFQYELGTFFPKADHAYSPGKIDSLTNTVHTLWDKYDAPPVLLFNTVQKRLQPFCYVINASLVWL